MLRCKGKKKGEMLQVPKRDYEGALTNYFLQQKILENESMRDSLNGKKKEQTRHIKIKREKQSLAETPKH